MGFGDAVAVCLRKFVTFRGRADRAEFWYWVLFYLLVVLVLTFVDIIVVGVSTGPFSTFATILLLLPTFAATARRLHDTERSGWWLLLAVVPIIGVIILAMMTSLPGTRGPNRFGPEPA